jgi:hypothetical protein
MFRHLCVRAGCNPFGPLLVCENVLDGESFPVIVNPAFPSAIQAIAIGATFSGVAGQKCKHGRWVEGPVQIGLQVPICKRWFEPGQRSM